MRHHVHERLSGYWLQHYLLYCVETPWAIFLDKGGNFVLDFHESHHVFQHADLDCSVLEPKTSRSSYLNMHFLIAWFGQVAFGLVAFIRATQPSSWLLLGSDSMPLAPSELYGVQGNPAAYTATLETITNKRLVI